MVFEQVLGMPHAYIPFTPERPGHLDVINAYLHGLRDLPDRAVRRVEVRQPGRGDPLGEAGGRVGPVGRGAPAPSTADPVPADRRGPDQRDDGPAAVAEP